MRGVQGLNKENPSRIRTYLVRLVNDSGESVNVALGPFRLLVEDDSDELNESTLGPVAEEQTTDRGEMDEADAIACSWAAKCVYGWLWKFVTFSSSLSSRSCAGLWL